MINCALVLMCLVRTGHGAHAQGLVQTVSGPSSSECQNAENLADESRDLVELLQRQVEAGKEMASPSAPRTEFDPLEDGAAVDEHIAEKHREDQDRENDFSELETAHMPKEMDEFLESEKHDESNLMKGTDSIEAVEENKSHSEVANHMANLIAREQRWSRRPRRPTRKYSASRDSMVWQMAQIASGIYTLNKSISGWRLVAGAAHRNGRDTDYFGVYEKKKVCVMAFAGSNSAGDFVNNANAYSRSYCGLNNQIHSGFVTELEGCRRSPAWPQVEQALSDKNICGRSIITVGHSLGSAMCEIFAACVNSNASYHIKHKPNRGVDAIYAFAGPGPSKIQLTNAQSKDGCFAGARFFNLDYWSGDSVPKAAYPAGYRHPKLKAVRLNCERSWWSLPGYCTMRKSEYACGSADAKGRPWTVSSPLPSMHSITTYIDRVAKLYG